MTTMDQRTNTYRACLGILLVLGLTKANGQLLDTEFQPTVTATCNSGYMTIRVNLNQSFTGAVHARDYRTPQCMTPGDGSNHVTLGINLFAPHDAPDYCGVLINNKTEERSVPIAVRMHKTLELVDDKFYIITCGKPGFKNANNQTSLVSLRLLDNGRRVQEAFEGHNYTLRAEISRPDGTYGIRVKSCFAFDKINSSAQLIDEKGCPVDHVMTKFVYDRDTGIADAVLFKMFKFTDNRQVHFQCDIAICRGSCGTPICSGDDPSQIKDDMNVAGEEAILVAGTGVFVLEPGTKPSVLAYEEGGVHPVWVLWLAVALGILFIIMLIINIFLCSAMSCSCARTEIIEKEPSIIEDYDPYRSWHGSQYGSRVHDTPNYTIASNYSMKEKGKVDRSGSRMRT